MKTAKLLIAMLLANIAIAQNVPKPIVNYQERASSWFLIGNISLGASLLCLGGVAATDVPKFDPTKANDSYYVRQYENDYNSWQQTKQELLVIGSVTGAMALTSYTIAAFSLRKASKPKNTTAIFTPTGVYFAYRF